MSIPDGAIFRALADPTRRQILQELKRGELPAGVIAARFPIRAPSISRHLAILKAAGLVVERREGNRILYRLQENRLLSALGDFISTVCPGQNILRFQERQKREEA
jgi:DNA-binding transcriptional ArsR family regulator